MNDIIEFFRSIFNNDYLTLYVISIIPIIELRGAIVFMTGMFSSVQEMIAGMFCCVAGATTVILPLILIVRPLIRRMKRTKWFSKIAKSLESSLADRAEAAYSEEKEEQKAAKLENSKRKRKRKPLSTDAKKFLGLFTFVAVPLPMTGTWTGAAIGSFLEFPIWKAALAVFLGNIVAASILTAIAYFMPQQYADLFMYGFVILAVAVFLTVYFTQSKKTEKRRKEEIAKYNDKNEYELAIIRKEAEENGEYLIKKEYIDENGDKHIIIGRDSKRNEDLVDKDDII